MTLSRTLSRSRHRAAAILVGAALLAPLSPAVPAGAAPSKPPASHAGAAHAARPTQLGLAAYGDADPSGAVHLYGWLGWSNGKPLARPQRLELRARTGSTWSVVRRVTTDRFGDVEVRVRPTVRTTYQLRYAGSSEKALGARAGASRSRTVVVGAPVRVTLTAPASAERGTTFVVSGRVTPAGARRSVVLTGDGATFAVLTSRADGTWSARVRLRQTTKLAVRVPAAGGLEGAVSSRRTVRVV